MRNPPVILNLLTGPRRYARVHRVAESLLRQTLRPDRFVLWLKPELWDGTPGGLPRRLRRLCERGLEVRVCRDSVFDELVPLRELAQPAVVIVADEDRIYPPEWLETLCERPSEIASRRFNNGPFLPAQDGAWRRIRAGLAMAPPPARSKARGTAGIVTAAGSAMQLVNACLCVRRLRYLGCTLPLELYHTAAEVIPGEVRRAFPADTRFVEIAEPGVSHFGIKPWALWATPFQHCLWIDADNLALSDPAFILDERAGALAWPDLCRWNHPTVYEVFPELPREEPEFETGQFAIDSLESAPALWQTILLNREFRDHVRVHMLGDKDTFRLALRLSGFPYRWADSLVSCAGSRNRGADERPWKTLGLLQHYPAGQPLFLHRTIEDWNPLDPPRRVTTIGARTAAYSRGCSWNAPPEREAPMPASVREVDAWAADELPGLLFFLARMPPPRLADRLRVRWRLFRQTRMGAST